MPAPGPKDGHMSKSSRDLSKGIAVKSNGFKYGGGSREGWGTGGGKGRRPGKGNGARDVAARERLRERLEARERAKTEGGAEMQAYAKAAEAARAGEKRKRDGDGGDGRGEGREEDAEKAPRRIDDESPDPEPEPEPEPRGAKSDAAAERYECVTCGVQCGSAANYASHRDSKRHKAAAQRERGAFYTMVPIRRRSRGERRSLRTLPGASLRPSLAFNTHPRRLSTSTDAFQLHRARAAPRDETRERGSEEGDGDRDGDGDRGDRGRRRREVVLGSDDASVRRHGR